VKRNKKIPAVFFCTESGNEPVREWLLSLMKVDRKVIGDDIQTVQYGWPIGMPLVDSVEKGIWEVRTKLDKRIARVLFTPHENQLVLLHGFIKKTQTPKADKALARNRLKELQRRFRKNEE